jgi:hypothetical protein
MNAFQVIAVLLWLASIGWLVFTVTRPRGAAGTRQIPRRGAPTESVAEEPASGPRTEHLRRGQADTVRVPQGQNPNAQPTTKLMPKEAPKPSQQDTLARANRLQELGFHTGVAPTVAPKPAPAPSAPVAAEAPAPAATPAEAAPAEERLQTSDLDAILSRIDQVLADTAAPAKTGEDPKATQPTAKPAEPGGQQQLF